MKKYHEYMNEISGAELYKALLGYGFFPEKMPPLFTSEDFYNYCEANNPSFCQDRRQYIYYESMRNINIPRQLGVPVPMVYQRLCKYVSDIWTTELVPYFFSKTCNQRFKVSRIHIRKMHGKSAIFEMNYKNWKMDNAPEDQIIMGKRYVVHADISKCFPSIYTHALSWALVSKNVAKATMSQKNLYYNKLDHLVQINKDLETHGLLIGPHVSNILSEIILCAVDYELVNIGWEFIRCIDDYTAYVKSESEAEEFLVDLQEELRKYDLTLNHKKTSIAKLPLAMTEQWTRRIVPVAILTSYGQVDYKKCRAYLDSALEIAESEKWNSSVLNWAIKALSEYELTDNAKKYEKNVVFHLAVLYPYLVPLLEDYVFSNCDATVDEIRDLAILLFNEGLNARRYEQVSYAIYFAIKYGFDLNVDVNKIICTKDCVLLAVSLMYFRNKQDMVSVNKLEIYAETLNNMPGPEDFDQNWLFAYEALPASKLQGDWKTLKLNGVSFFKKT